MASQHTWALSLLFLFWPLVACVPLTAVAVNPPLTTEGEVLVFLQPLGEKAAPLTFTIEAVGVRRQDGTVMPLALSNQEIIGADRVHTQFLLAKARVPAGLYDGLALTVRRAAIMTEEGPVALQIDQEQLWLPMEMAIPAKKAMALFLTFHPDKSLESHVLFKPVFSVKTSSQLPLARLGYVSMPQDNKLLIFHDNSILFTGVIATGMQPRGMAIDREGGRLYTALAGDAIEVSDIFQQATFGTLRLWPGDDPQEVALSPDGRTLVSANYGSNTVSIVDPLALLELRRVAVGSGPTDVAFSPAGNVAYCMNSQANTISVVDTEKMQVAATIPLEESPLKGALNSTGSELYVITDNSPNLLVLDLPGGTTIHKIFIGLGARSILVDSRSSLVYVGRRNGEIVVVDPALRSAIDALQLEGGAESMAISDEGNYLFALLPRAHSLKKVNLVSKEVLGSIHLEGEGAAISLVGAR